MTYSTANERARYRAGRSYMKHSLRTRQSCLRFFLVYAVLQCVTPCRRSIVQYEHSSNWKRLLIVVQSENDGDPTTLKITQCELGITFPTRFYTHWRHGCLVLVCPCLAWCCGSQGLRAASQGHQGATLGWTLQVRERGCAGSLSLSTTCTSLAHFHSKLILNKSNVENLYYKLMAQKLSFPIFLTEDLMITKSCPVQ